jgi:hypothetical protein
MAPSKPGKAQSDPDALRHYTIQAQEGRMTEEDLEEAESHLNRGDYKAIVRKNAANITNSPAKREYRRLGKELLRRVSKSDGSIFNDDASADAYYQTSQALEFHFDKFKAEHDGRAPNLEETYAIHEQILKARKGAGQEDPSPAARMPQSQPQDRSTRTDRLNKLKSKKQSE